MAGHTAVAPTPFHSLLGSMTETQLKWPTGGSCDPRVQGQLGPAPASPPTLSSVLSAQFLPGSPCHVRGCASPASLEKLHLHL